jgi:hypothetical protein
MFDRIPDATVVADLVRAQHAPEVGDPDVAAAELIEHLMGWQRVAAWVESQRLDTMRRFAAARTAADETVTSSPTWSPRSRGDRPGRTPRVLQAAGGRHGDGGCRAPSP